MAHRSNRRGAQPATHRSTTRREQRRYDPISSEAPSTDSTRNTAERGARSPRRAAARRRTHSCSPGRTRMVRAGSCRTESGATRGDSAVKVAIYARYSSDNQRDASIADQLRVCQEFAAREGWTVVQEFTDHAVSGATLLRPGFQTLMRDALNGRFDVVLAEALDRFSRDQEDTAGLFKRLTFAGVNIVTLAEGDITHLHVGLKGTMNALFLKDLADKTRRGLRGRVELGKSGGGLCYGYKVTRAGHQGEMTTGEREIVSPEAEVIRRIFRDYAAGVSPKALAKRLNGERCSGPNGKPWNPSTIHGNPARGTGILNNELYVGRLVWNRLRYVKESGHRQTRFAAQSILGVGDDSGSPPAHRRRRSVGAGEGAASRDAPRDVERRSEAVQPGTPPEVSLLRSDEMRRVRRRIRHVLARPPGVLRRAFAWHVHQPPDDQPPGGGRTRSRGTARQADAPRPVRGLLPRVRAGAEPPADGASRKSVARSPASSRAVEREIRKFIQAIKDGVLRAVDQGRAAGARSAEGRTAVAPRRTRDAGAAAPADGRRLSREGRQPLPRLGEARRAARAPWRPFVR